MSLDQDSIGSGSPSPIGILIVSLIFGGYMLVNEPFSARTAFLRWVIVGLSALGLLYIIVGFRGVRQRSGLHRAVNWLFSGSGGGVSGASERTRTNTEKTPPAPESLKNELDFERADRRCEWCNERVDSPDVHHIEPRSEGGSNAPGNLIVLCPNCHRKADGGTISRSKLKYQVNR
ncbi:HNH endonuclease [Halomarina pelagica]|uniref:HNH endonuclease n=1 Tax=Halomarina pelagica TaxID=2961599 RepID=UPI0020C25000|nr:HNH endonuclease [Halomarina sp. BND7]